MLRDLAVYFFFFNDTATTEIYTLSLHDALPISAPLARRARDELAGHHQGLFVREGDALTGPQRCERGLEPRRPNDAVHDDAHVRVRGGFHEAFRPLAPSPFPLPRIDQRSEERRVG